MTHLVRFIQSIVLFFIFNTTYAQIFLDNNAAFEVNAISSGATWQNTHGQYEYNNNGTQFQNRAVLYSTESFQSEDGFKLTIEYTTGSIEDDLGHNFSFGLISDETDLSAYSGFNPFRATPSVYSIGANLTTDEDASARGLNFTNGTSRVTLDESGTRAQFVSGEKAKVIFEIGIGGYWSYRINDIYEASGVLLEEVDLTKNFHVAIYGQDDNGGGKSIASIKLEKRYAAGERAENVRGTWSSGIHVDLMDAVKDFKTLDGLGVGFTDGAVLSAKHYAAHKLFDILPGGDAVAPAWGDLSSDEPETNKVLDEMLKVKAAGFKVKAYTNSECFVGNNTEELEVFVTAWKAYCDTNSEVQTFINSQPFHTGIWNRTTEQYEDATITHPNRKYMFCYAEYFLKDFALRYGEYVDNWIFDDGGTMAENGDNATSGRVEEQRIYQAFANAVHAGNPEIPVSFNNGRSTTGYFATPFAHAVRFEDFTFGHAFGGNNNHGSKTGGQFNNNYRHIQRMTATQGRVFTGNDATWDDQIVGNFHSKTSTTAWKYGPTQAWEQADFNQWNLEAMQAGGSMTWDGSFDRNITFVRDWAIVLLKGLDDYLCQHESPGAPNWARAYTILPDATIGEAYYHVLEEGTHFWDPEGDDIIDVSTVNGIPGWLNINEDPENQGQWILSGIPTETSATVLEFELQATDIGNLSGTRKVELKVNEGDGNIIDQGNGIPVWVTDLFEFDVIKYDSISYTFRRGKDFADFDGDALTIEAMNTPPGLSFSNFAPDIWTLNGTPECGGLLEMELALSDAVHTVNTTIQINVIEPQFLNMTMQSIKGNASWSLDNEEYTYVNSGVNYDNRSLLYSTEAHQSNEGFRVTVNYTTGTVDKSLAHNFSFGLVSDETDLANYSGFNPFGSDLGVYSIGVNLVGPDNNGLNITRDGTITNIDQVGTHADFPINTSSEVVIEILSDGAWSYSIDGTEEASGIFSNHIDLSKSYHVVVYGQDDNGGGKSIQRTALETCLNSSVITFTETSNPTNLTAYPNPTSGIVQFQKEVEYKIYNAVGTEILNGKGTQFELINQPNGMYIVRISDGEDVAIEKITLK